MLLTLHPGASLAWPASRGCPVFSARYGICVPDAALLDGATCLEATARSDLCDSQLASLNVIVWGLVPAPKRVCARPMLRAKQVVVGDRSAVGACLLVRSGV
jgi:hypothetical protein